MYRLGTIYSGSRRVILTDHALQRAGQREISADMIKETIMGGRQMKKERIINFFKCYENGKLICIGERTNGTIIIKTLVWEK